MSTPHHGWLPPRCVSRTGAAHRRRGTPCQDACGLWSFVDGDGQPLQVLVVSDGHGGGRYDRSEVGSRLACRVALVEIQHKLARARLSEAGHEEEWRQWLAGSLPQALLERWRREVLIHAAAHPRSDGQAASVLPYGATLGLLLLTPRWWGHTGLGDWDLVRIDAAGDGVLLSEEPDHPGGGEATFSLCMEDAERHFEPRSGLVPIPAGQPAFSLLLSSDGIRKSCGSDADFLTLARHLCELPSTPTADDPTDLGRALDHISSQGSGDDVSAAIGRWGPLGTRPRRDEPAGASQPLIVQPAPERPGQEGSGPGAVAVSLADRDGAERWEISSDPVERPGRGWAFPWLRVALVALAMAAAGVGTAAVLGRGPFAAGKGGPEQASPELAGVVQQKATELCRLPPDHSSAAEATGNAIQPNRDPRLLSPINDSLNQRRITFRELQNGSKPPSQFLSDPAKDPTGALIAWSFTHPGQEPQLPPAERDPGFWSGLIGRLPFQPERGGTAQGAAAPLAFCPELQQALMQQWQRVRQQTGPQRRAQLPRDQQQGRPLEPRRQPPRSPQRRLGQPE